MDAETVTLELVRVEEADDAGALRLGVQEYLLRSGEGTYAPATLRWDEALLEQLAQVRAREPGATQALGAALRRFVSVIQFAAIEAAIAGAVAAGRTIRLEVLSNAAELYALPWELLTLADGRHVGELPGVEIVYRWPGARGAADARPQEREGGRVLVAWSRAFGNVGEFLMIDAIEAAMRGVMLPFDRGRDVVEAASLPAIVAALEAKGEPVSLLVILCHGAPLATGYGLGLDDGRGGRTVVDGGTLRRALGPFAGQVRAVFVMACDSGNAGELGSQLGSVAHELHRGGIAAVVAPRAPVSGSAALALTGHVLKNMFSEAWSIEQAFRAARERLAREGGEWAAFQLYSHAGRAGTRPFAIRPYRGLLAFEREHVGLFFGREAELQEALGDLDALVAGGKPRLLVVAGASGTGKSSLVLAPLRVELERRGATVAVIRPGKEPLAALAEAREGRPAGRPFVLVVDQFEEVFTHGVDRGRAAEGSAFARELWSMASGSGGEVVILTLRIDFAGRCGELVVDEGGGRLDRVVYDEAHRVFVPQMTPEGLRSVIEGPARRVGLCVETGLAERLIREVAGECNALPLLSYVLDQLWRRREGERLTHAALAAVGGVTGALARHADAVIEALDEPARAQARRTLVHLVMFGSDRTSGTRRREEEEHVRSRRDPQAWERATAALLDARLMVRRGESEVTLEIAHEALIRRWDRLWEWYQADRERLLKHRELDQLVGQYRQYGSLAGRALAYGQTLLAGLDADEAPPGAAEAIAESTARARRRLWTRRGLLAGALLILATFSIVSIVLYTLAQRRAAEAAVAARRNADAAFLSAAQRLMGSKPHVAGALLRMITSEELFGWRQAAFEVLHEPLPTILPIGQAADLMAVAADGTVAIRDAGGVIRVWPAGGGPPREVAGKHPQVVSMGLDGERLFTIESDRVTAYSLAGDPIVAQATVTEPGGLLDRILVGGRTGTVLVTTRADAVAPSQTAWRVSGGKFEKLYARPRCIADDAELERSVCAAGADAVQVESWAGEVIGRVEAAGIGETQAACGGLQRSDVSGDEEVWLWPKGGLPGEKRVIPAVHTEGETINAVVFPRHTVWKSPGMMAAGRACTLPTTAGAVPLCEEVPSECWLLDVVDGQFMLGCPDDVQLRTAESLVVARHLRGLDAEVHESAVARTGHVAVFDRDHRLWRWRARDLPSRLAVIDGDWFPFAPIGYLRVPHLQAEHGRVVAVDVMNEALRVDVRVLQSAALPAIPPPMSVTIALQPDERWGGDVVTADAVVLGIFDQSAAQRLARVVVLTPREERIDRREVALPPSSVGTIVAATRDGATAFATSKDGTTLRLDLGGETAVIEPALTQLGKFVQIAAVHPSGRTLAVWRTGEEGEHEVELVDVATGTPLPRDEALAKLRLRSVSFASDGIKMALGTDDGQLAVAQLTEGGPLVLKNRLKRHRAAVVAVAFSRDGEMVAGADALGRLILWDRGLEGDDARVTVEVPETIWNVGISGDGRQLWALSQLGVLRYWTIPGDDAALRRELRERATYCPTVAELQEFAGVDAATAAAAIDCAS